MEDVLRDGDVVHVTVRIDGAAGAAAGVSGSMESRAHAAPFTGSPRTAPECADQPLSPCAPVDSAPSGTALSTVGGAEAQPSGNRSPASAQPAVVPDSAASAAEATAALQRLEDLRVVGKHHDVVAAASSLLVDGTDLTPRHRSDLFCARAAAYLGESKC